jgi:N-acetylneuraminate epimerase
VVNPAAIISLPLLLLMPALAGQSLSLSRLPDLPDREGLAGLFAGVSGDALIVAGGANFPDKRPWEGGAKVWRDEIWLLASPESDWKVIGRLPRPLAYGVSATLGDEMFCAGGSNAQGHHADCFALRISDGKLSRRELPPLPTPCANHVGAIVDGTLFVAGGIAKPDATTALHTFWSLDLRQTGATWVALEPWPGRERMLAVAGSLNGAFYLFGGAALHADAEGKPERDWLNDAFRFRPGRGWEKLAALPRVAVAAPSPAPATSTSLFILSGDDGSKFGFKPETEHPGFPRDALRFESGEGRWSNVGPVPFSRATVPTAAWRGTFVIPSGEARPGYRTPEVWQLDLR